MKDKRQIAENIITSKKYKEINPETVRNIVENTSLRYKENEVENKSRDIIHQIWGAYWNGRPKFKKYLFKIREDINMGKNSKEILQPVLNLHSSTKERIPIISDFYREIFEVTGIPSSINDFACGLNPLSYPWMGLKEDTVYRASDIDMEEVEFLNGCFKEFGLYPRFSAFTEDILIDDPVKSDISLFLKIYPLISHQKMDFFENVLKKVNSRFIVISFPVRSISGKQKGMENFYRNEFLSNLDKNIYDHTEIKFSSELVFILKKR